MRLHGRGDEHNSWAEQQVERCLAAFEHDIPGITVDAEAVVEFILKEIEHKI